MLGRSAVCSPAYFSSGHRIEDHFVDITDMVVILIPKLKIENRTPSEAQGPASAIINRLNRLANKLTLEA